MGVAELRYSPTYRAAWGRFTPGERLKFLRAEAVITIAACRPATNTIGEPFTLCFAGDAVYGNLLLVEQGGVEITVTVDSPAGSGSATTACCPKP